MTSYGENKMEFLDENKLCSTEYFISLQDKKQRMNYLQELYNGETPKVVAYISHTTTKNIIFARIKYMVYEKSNAIIRPRFFTNHLDEDITINTTPLNVDAYMKMFSLEEYTHILVEIQPGKDIFMKTKDRFFEGVGTPQKVTVELMETYKISDEDILMFCQTDHRMITSERISKLIRKEKLDYEEEKEKFDNECKLHNEIVTSIVDKKRKLEQDLEQMHQKHKDAEKEMQEKLEEEKKEKMLALEESLEKYKKKLSFFESCVEELFEETYGEEDNNNNLPIVTKDNLRDYIDEMQVLLCRNYNLKYDFDILFSFYVALQSDQMILLVGNPGSGKSSLARNFPKIFGFNDAVFIPVQSNWDSKNNLLGYYNPMEKKFMPEIFLSELVRLIQLAKINKEKLFFVCLDEMNIAHVEHYFAEFLSILQGDRKLRLYPKDIYNEIKNEIELYENTSHDDNSTLDESILQQQIEDKKKMLLLYPQEIEIPKNIKFIGTLNQDETTLDLSPKVLNRSFVIKMSGGEDIIVENNNEQDDKHILNYKTIDDFEGTTTNTFEDYDAAIQDKIKKMMSYRLQKQFIKTDIFDKWNAVGYLNKYFDSVIAGTILPSISVSDEQGYQEKVNEIKSLLAYITNKNTISKTIFNQMNHQEERELYYWEK